MSKNYRVLNTEDMEFISPWNYGAGAILKDYSYIGNNFMDIILNEIYEGTWKNKPIVWMHDENAKDVFTEAWENAFEVSCCHPSTFTKNLDYSNVFIINNDKKEYIDLVEYKLQWKCDRKKIIHPFPIMINSSKQTINKKDFNNGKSQRGKWTGDRFVVEFEHTNIPFGYKNITKEVLCYTQEQEKKAKDLFRQEALKYTKMPDLEKRNRIINDPKDIGFKRNLFEI